MLQRRSLRHSGGRLALFAVFLQLVLSFGHIHPSDIFPFGHAVAQGQGVAQFVASDQDSSPAGQNETGAAGQACAICANMALAASLVLPDPVGVAPPNSTVRMAVAVHVTLLIAAAPHLLFQTRAPPSA
jgi:hypothetical protein